MARAVVVGGSFAGLSAAKVLSEYFDEVIIVEADNEPEGISARKGVPQGRHVHGLLKGGADALISLFPDLPTRLKENGAASADFCNEVKWYLNKEFMQRFPGDLPIHFQSRPLLEFCIREAVKQIGNVSILYGTKVQDYLLNDARDSVEGVSIKNKEGTEETLQADIVVDASGRGTMLPKWLENAGFGQVPVTETKVNLGYASCFMRLPDDASRDWTSLLIYPTGPDEIKGCTLVKVENDTWLLTLAGYHDDHPPSDKEGFMAFAKALPRPEVYEAIKDAEFISDISLHKFPSSLRRHYNKTVKLPSGLIPVGDSNVSLNPLFGQGMSVAVLSVVSLADLIKRFGVNSRGSRDQLQETYLNSLDRIFHTPWDLAMGQDFRYPQTEGKIPLGWAFKNYFKEKVLSSSSKDIIRQFFGVVHLVEKETTFYNPLKVLKVFLTAKN